MTAFFACVAVIAGLFALIQWLRLEVERVATAELRDANRRLEVRNKELENRLTQYRENYRPQPGDFNRLHAIRGGRRG